MKIRSLALLGTLIAFPAFGNQATYDGLTVAEVDKTPAGLMGSVKFEKAVGGLVCQKTQVVRPNAVPEYKCGLKNKARSDADIYAAIFGNEVNITPTGLLGSTTYEKKVGLLTCQKTQVVYPGAEPEYKCKLAQNTRNVPPKKHHTGLIFEAQ